MSNRPKSAGSADSVTHRLLVPIPGSAEMGRQVTAAELADIAARILCEAPDPLTAIQRLKAEVDTWRFLSAGGASLAVEH